MDMETEDDDSQNPPPPPPGTVKFYVKHQECQGGRPHMEDRLRYSYEKDEDGTIRTIFFGMFDGHGGSEASEYTKDHLLRHITSIPDFHSDDDSVVLSAMKKGFLSLHREMLQKRNNNWAKNASGRLSISGTTATVVFFKSGKLYIANVGDSALVLGYEGPGDKKNGVWSATQLTQDHKPESPLEKKRIEEAGAKVINYRGMFRIKTETATTLLNLGRSLGDFWSWNPAREEYVVSPVPDTMVVNLEPGVHKCLILASDGLWNVVKPEDAVEIVNETTRKSKPWKKKSKRENAKRRKRKYDPAARLVERARNNWETTEVRADNITVMSIVFEFV